MSVNENGTSDYDDTDLITGQPVALPKSLRRKSGYYDRIHEEAERQGFGHFDPRHIEAYMRLEHSTLDGLAPWQFRNEVKMSIECIKLAGTAEAEDCAQSFGL